MRAKLRYSPSCSRFFPANRSGRGSQRSVDESRTAGNLLGASNKAASDIATVNRAVTNRPNRKWSCTIFCRASSAAWLIFCLQKFGEAFNQGMIRLLKVLFARLRRKGGICKKAAW